VSAETQYNNDDVLLLQSIMSEVERSITDFSAALAEIQSHQKQMAEVRIPRQCDH
jgi:hypothetical protein